MKRSREGLLQPASQQAGDEDRIIEFMNKIDLADPLVTASKWTFKLPRRPDPLTVATCPYPSGLDCYNAVKILSRTVSALGVDAAFCICQGRSTHFQKHIPKM